MLDAVTLAAAAVLCFLVASLYANLGLGGGLLFVPILLSLGVAAEYGASQNKVLVPISLTLTIATALAAIVTHGRRGLLDRATAGILLGGALFGTVAGTAVNVLLLSRETFVVFFTAVLIAFGVLMLREKLSNGAGGERDDDARYTPGRKAAASAASVGSGFLSGASGVGGGLVNVPIMTLILGRQTRKALGSSHLVIAPVAALGFALTLLLNASVGLPVLPPEFLAIPVLFPLVFLGGYIGSSVGLARLKTRWVTLIFIAVVFLTAAKLLVVDLLRWA